MEYEKGYLHLSESEVDTLSSLLMTEFEARYEANDFIGGMMEAQASLVEETERYRSMCDRGKREDLIINLYEVMHDYCGRWIEVAREAAAMDGKTINMH